jgi:hypothetical protein
MLVASDAIASLPGAGLRVTHSPSLTRIFVSGRFGHAAVGRLDDALGALPADGAIEVLLRITSDEVEFGAVDALREALVRRRMVGRHRVAVWADEPLIRRGIPLALLHSTPPHGGRSWEMAVPAVAEPP